jgi:hypothetical protein
MIHYGIQYQELLRKAADAVTSTKLEWGVAQQAKAEADRHQVAASNRLRECEKSFTAAKQDLAALMDADATRAVELYREKNGRYPV